MAFIFNSVCCGWSKLCILTFIYSNPRGVIH
jgi:hypothetical protein